MDDDKIDFAKYTDSELVSMYKEAKGKEIAYHTSQIALKTNLNSYYGATGTPYFRYYDSRLARGTTLSGQLLNRYVGQAIEKYINKVCQCEGRRIVYGDTDSVYIDIYPFYDKFGKKDWTHEQRVNFYDAICEKITKDVITPTIADVLGTFNAFQNVLGMDREVICAGSNDTKYCGFFCAKKKYALLVDDMEGYRPDKPKLKVMGLSLVQSSTPKFFRERLSILTRKMIEEGFESARKYAKSVEDEYFALSVEDIALPRSVTNVDQYADANGMPIKGTPVQSKAAVNYNRLVRKHGLEKKYQIIKDGEKLHFVYLSQNPEHIDVIGFRDKLPVEFGLNKYVDYGLMLYRAFLKPVEDLFTSAGESFVKKQNLDDLFG